MGLSQDGPIFLNACLMGPSMTHDISHPPIEPFSTWWSYLMLPLSDHLASAFSSLTGHKRYFQKCLYRPLYACPACLPDQNFCLAYTIHLLKQIEVHCLSNDSCLGIRIHIQPGMVLQAQNPRRQGRWSPSWLARFLVNVAGGVHLRTP